MLLRAHGFAGVTRVIEPRIATRYLVKPGMVEPSKNDPLCIRCNVKMRSSCKEIEKPGFVHDVFECPKCRSTQSYVTPEQTTRLGGERRENKDRKSGRVASNTQPFPTRPAPFDIQSAHDDDLIDLTPEIHKEATEIAASFDRGGLFTPPSLRGTIQVPGKTGGANWAGAAVDPETGIMYVGTQRLPSLATVRKPQPSESSYDFIGGGQFLSGPRGLPLLKPPFGSIVAIDMNTGEHRWRIPIGRGELIPAIRQLGAKERLGFPTRSWALITKTVMIVVQSGYFGAPRLPPGGTRRIADLNNFDPHLWVYDKASGEMLAEIALPANAVGAPITYMAGGKQYIAFSVGGGPLVEEMIAVSL